MKKYVWEDKAIIYCVDDFEIAPGWVEKRLTTKEKKNVPAFNDNGYVVVRVK